MNSPASHQEIGRLLNAWKETLLLATHERNFKNGAFKTQITPSTNIIDGIDIFIASPLLSEKEKAVFSDAGASIVRVLTGSSRMTSFDLTVEMMMVTQRVTDFFDEDGKKQGQYIPPMMIQSFGKDGKLEKTFEITDEGTKTTKGGEFGVVPSAPDEVKQQQRAHAREMGIGIKADGTKKGRKESSDSPAKSDNDLGKDDLGGKDGKRSAGNHGSECTILTTFICTGEV
jgi:hypothetical protein